MLEFIMGTGTGVRYSLTDYINHDASIRIPPSDSYKNKSTKMKKGSKCQQNKKIIAKKKRKLTKKNKRN